MSVSSFNKKYLWLIILPVWTYAAFWLAQFVILALQYLLVWLGVPLAGINTIVFTAVISALAYTVALLIVIGVPYHLWRKKTTAKDLGANDWPAWMDILLSPLAFVVYIIASGIFMAIVTSLLPAIDLNQAQQLPFTQNMLGASWHYVLAFLTLVIIAPLAEELLFRGYLYGKLRKTMPIWISVLVTSLAFGAAHLWGGPGSPLQWAVMVDTFVLSIMLCYLREYTGAVWASVLVHSIKNGLAFYLLFVNPQIIDQLQAAILPLL